MKDPLQGRTLLCVAIQLHSINFLEHFMPGAVCTCLLSRGLQMTRQSKTNWKLKSQQSSAGEKFVGDAMGIQKREISSRLEAGGPSWRHSVGELHLERLVGVS